MPDEYWADSFAKPSNGNSASPKTPSYALPTISFARHYSIKGPTRKLLASKAHCATTSSINYSSKATDKGAKVLSLRSTRDNNGSNSTSFESSTVPRSRSDLNVTKKASDTKHAAPFYLVNLFGRGSEKSKSKKMRTSNESPYATVFSSEIEKENIKMEHTYDALYRPNKDRFWTLDGDKENANPQRKSSYQPPVLKSKPVTTDPTKDNNNMPLKTRYERLAEPLELISPAVYSVLANYYQDSGSSTSSSAAFPKDYLKSLVTDKDVVSAQEWYKLVDVISSLVDAAFASQSQESQYLIDLNNDLQKQIIHNDKLCQQVIGNLDELKMQMYDPVNQNNDSMSKFASRVNEIKEKLTQKMLTLNEIHNKEKLEAAKLDNNSVKSFDKSDVSVSNAKPAPQSQLTSLFRTKNSSFHELKQADVQNAQHGTRIETSANVSNNNLVASENYSNYDSDDALKLSPVRLSSRSISSNVSMNEDEKGKEADGTSDVCSISISSVEQNKST